MTKKEIIQIKSDHPNSQYYIIKRGYFFREGAKGYAEPIEDAGLFSKEDALSYINDTGIHISKFNLEQYNQEILNKIEILKSKLKRR